MGGLFGDDCFGNMGCNKILWYNCMHHICLNICGVNLDTNVSYK